MITYVSSSLLLSFRLAFADSCSSIFRSYDKYYQTPRVWLLGYDEVCLPLPFALLDASDPSRFRCWLAHRTRPPSPPSRPSKTFPPTTLTRPSLWRPSLTLEHRSQACTLASTHRKSAPPRPAFASRLLFRSLPSPNPPLLFPVSSRVMKKVIEKMGGAAADEQRRALSTSPSGSSLPPSNSTTASKEKKKGFLGGAIRKVTGGSSSSSSILSSTTATPAEGEDDGGLQVDYYLVIVSRFSL